MLLPPDPIRIAPHTIERSRLTDVLETVPPGGVSVLVAPPGWGKSVLAGQWARTHRSAVVAVTPAHDDTVVLAHDLVGALHTVAGNIDLGIARLAVHGGARLGHHFLDALTAELAEAEQPVVLVLDDAHRFSNPGVFDDLEELVRLLPVSCRLLLASRWDLPLHISRLRVAGGAVELRWPDLALDLSEATRMLDLATGRSLGPDQAGTLWERTQGWPAGLQLAALTLQGAADDEVAGMIARFAGDDRLVADYLTKEVLDSLSRQERTFLMRTSVLDTLSPGLCEAVTGHGGARRTLTELVDRGLFTDELPGRPGEFRYHQLFAELLRFQLRLDEPDAEMEYHRRAARWHLTHGNHRDAVGALIAAGDDRQAFDIIAAEGHRLFERGETATLARGLGLIHDRDPAPSVTMLVSLLASQVGADQFTEAAETYQRLTDRDDVLPGERVAADTLATVLGLGDLPLPEMKRLGEKVLADLPRLDRDSVVDFLGAGGADSCETMAAFFSALADLFAGDAVVGASRFASILDLPGARYPIWRVNSLGALALALAWTGDLDEAEARAVSALTAAREVDAMDHIACSLAHLAHGLIRLDRLDHGGAGLQLDAATRVIERCHRPAYHDLLLVLRARQLAATAGIRPALDLLREVPRSGRSRPLVARIRTSLEVRLLVRSGATREARTILDLVPDPAPAARFDVLAAEGDLTRARDVLTDWSPDSADARSVLEHDLRRAVLTHLGGHPGGAGTMAADLAVGADVRGLRAPLLEVPLVASILRTSMPVRDLRRLIPSLAETPVVDTRALANDQLIEPLTPREVSVLEYLPTRLSNAEVAAALFVSVNTLKTHLRNIYRKLEAPDRDAAAERATRLGLL